MELLLKLYRGGYMSAEGVSESKRILEKGIVLPWCGEDEKKCKNIKKNGGLYTQCVIVRNVEVENVEYCKVCEKSISKNGGVCEYGNVSERLSCGIMEYVDRKGGKVKSYSEYMKKNKLERSDVEKYGQMCGVVIPACHFENDVLEKKKRGRPKSEKEMTEGIVDVEKKKRGRPKKEKQVVANGAGEELIASLCLPGLPSLPTAELRCCLPTTELRYQDTSESSSEAPKPSADTADSEAPKPSADSEAPKPSADSEAPKPSADSEAPKPSADSEAPKPSADSEAPPPKPSSDTADMADDEEETIVIKFDILGVTYLKSQDNVLYDINTHDAVGVWNEEKSEIDELPDEEEEE